VADDDLDLDLDLDTGAPDNKPGKRGLFARKPKPAPAPKKAAPATPAAPKPPAAAPAPVAPKAAAPAGAAPADPTAPDRPVTVMASRKPGLFARLLGPISSRFGRVHAPVWNLRNFGLGVLILALLVVVVENWPPMRLSFLGLHVDLPKALALVIVFALGVVVGWLPSRRKSAERTDS
jgi:uncharacterized integral membrane protein